jgi:oligosaccharide repeat unit polymerase
MILTIIICLVFLLLSLICSKNNLFSPGVITSGLWFCILVLYLFLSHTLNPLTNKYYIAINLWVALFCLSSLFMQSLSFATKPAVTPSTLTRNILFYISILTFPLVIWKIYELAKLGASPNMMNNLRAVAVGGIKNVNIEDASPFYIIIWFVSYLIELNQYSKKNRHRVLILFMMYFVYAAITMAKIHFLILFVSTAYLLYSKKVLKIKHISLGVLCLFFVFEGVQMLRSSSTIKDTHLAKNMISLYLLSPSPAFSTVKPESSQFFGENVFRFIYALNYKSGLSAQKPVDTFLPFVNVGTGTNTYTILYPFYKDFGLAGVGFFAVVLGLIMGYVYNKAENGNLIFIIIYAFLLYQIMMQYAAEMFFTNFSLNIKRLIIVLLPFFISKYELFFKNKKYELIEKKDLDD